MDSIYHIETDIECKVLHYGKEVCIAIPGQDSSIELRKGRHKLTFINAENPVDQYSIMYEVPENDIEDFIEVELKPIRDKRLADEAEARRIAYEAEQKRIFDERKRREEQELKHALEKEIKEKELQLKKQEEERKQRIMPIAIALKDGKEYDDRYWGTWEEDYSLFPKLFENGKIGFVDFNGNTQIQPRYEWRNNGNHVYGFSEGLSCVIEQYVPVVRRINGVCSIEYVEKLGYIDSRGDLVLSGLFSPRKYGFHPFFSQDRIIVLQREQVGIREYWVREGHKTEEWNLFLKAPSPGLILDKRRYDENGPKEEICVQMPVYSSKYVLLDKNGVAHKIIPHKKGYCAPYLFPFSQGLSIIVWIADQSESFSNLIEVIDRQGNLVLTYENLPDFKGVSTFEMPPIFLGEKAYVRISNTRRYLELSLDGTFKLLEEPKKWNVSDALQRAYDKLIFYC